MFNGLLLSANLDALFDSYLITFDNDGLLLVAPLGLVPLEDRELLGVTVGMRLRWIAPQHRP